MDGKSIVLSGTIAMGKGEGTYFMSMKHYRKEIKEKLGFLAYPGTLNLKVGEKNIDIFKEINPIKINGHKSNGKILGGARCYIAIIRGIRGSIIIPELTKHKGVIEFIAPVHLKSELKIKDGDSIKLKIFQMPSKEEKILNSKNLKFFKLK